uniref:F-box domain-containing protein n=1 Tax=Setaria viridis TaxID=4556 RepID=A0A4U6T0D6_SETVI|nr:hypothetical protein SEVIR_9G326200v2 [Setaria viridis]
MPVVHAGRQARPLAVYGQVHGVKAAEVEWPEEEMHEAGRGQGKRPSLGLLRLPTSPRSPHPPPPMELPPVEPQAATATVLMEDILRTILRLLSPADLLRAALACHRWCHVASLVRPRAPPLLGYFFHPCIIPGPPPLRPVEPGPYRPAIFLPLSDTTASATTCLSIDDARGFAIQDVHLGLLLLLPDPVHRKILPRIHILDLASRHPRTTHCLVVTAGAAAGTAAAGEGGSGWKGGGREAGDRGRARER